MTDVALLLLGVVALPIAGALFALLMPGDDRLALRAVGMAAMIASGCAALAAFVSASAAPVTARIAGVQVGLDALSGMVLLAIAIGGPIALRGGAPRILERSQFYVVTVLFAQGLLLAAVVATAPVLKIGLAAIAGVPMFALVSLFGGPLRGTTTYRAALIWLGVDVAALAALAWLAALSGTHAGEATAASLARGFAALSGGERVLVTIAVAGPGLLRLAAGPFSVWLQPFLDEAPLSAAMIAVVGAAPLGALLIADVALPATPGGLPGLAVPITALAAGAALLSGVIALGERDLRRLTAQLVFLAAATATPALVVGTRAGVAVGLMHVIAVGATAAALLVVIEAIERRYETRDAHALSGLSASGPLLAGLLAVCVLGLVGLPGLCAGGTAWLAMSAVVAAPDVSGVGGGAVLALGLGAVTALAHALAAGGVLAQLRRLFSPPTARARRDLVKVTLGQAARLVLPVLLAVATGLASAAALAVMDGQARTRAAASEAEVRR